MARLCQDNAGTSVISISQFRAFLPYMIVRTLDRSSVTSRFETNKQHRCRTDSVQVMALEYAVDLPHKDKNQPNLSGNIADRSKSTSN